MIGEPVASGLALDESMMWHSNFTVAAQYVMSPPIRSAQHAPALKKALAGGTLQLVATDHAVFTSKQKEMGKGDFRKIPNGVNGVEERLHVVWQEMVCTCHCIESRISKAWASLDRCECMCTFRGMCMLSQTVTWSGTTLKI